MSTPGERAAAAYGTSWRRSLPMLALALAGVGGVVGLVRAEVIAASVTYQGSTAKFATGRVTGQDVGFGMAQRTVKNADGTTSVKNVLSAGFATGTLDGFCLSQVQSVPVIGEVIIKLTAGDGNAATREINAINVQFDIAQLRGNNTGVNLDGRVQIGMASQDITTLAGVDNPLEAPTGTGWWGIDATAGDIFAAKGHLYDAEIGGPMTLPNLKITVTPRSAGGTECWSTLGDATAPPH